MATFEAQVEGLTSLSIDGSSSPNQTELTQFLTDGAKELINILPINLLHLCASEQSFTSGSPQTLNTGKVLYVTRSDGTIAQPCRNILPSLVGRSLDSGDMNAATTTDPIYYIKNNTLDVAPSSGSSVYSEVQYPTVAYSDSNVARFPDEVEYLIPLYASIKSLQNVLSSKTSDSDIETALTALNTELDESLPIADDIHSQVPGILSSVGEAKAEIILAHTEVRKMNAEALLDNDELDKATAELLETVTLVDNAIDTATGAITTAAGRINSAVILANDEFDEVATEVSSTTTSPITQARNAVPSAISINDLSIDVAIPVTPTINTISYTDASNNNANAVGITSSTASVISEVDVSSNAPSFVKPSVSLDFSQVNTHLDTNEDTELATVKIQEIQTQLNEYSSNIQNEQAEFNKENVKYQIEFQEATQKANNDLQIALANLNVEAQEKRQEASETVDVDKFNKQQDQILEIENSAKNMEKLIADNSSKLQKYTNELQLYQAQVGKDVQEYQSNLEQKLREFNSSIALQGSYYQEAQARINVGNSYLSEANTSAKEAQTYVSEVSARVQQIQSQIAIAQGYIANGAGYSRVANTYNQAAQSYLGTANSYLQSAKNYVASAQAYTSEIQSKIAISQAYARS